MAYTAKYDEFDEADEKVAKITEYYNQGMLTAAEKKIRIIEV